MPPLLPSSLLWAAGMVAGLTVCLVFLGIAMLWRSVPPEARDYLDPLPPGLRLLWPFIRAINLLSAHYPVWALERIHKRLGLASCLYLLSAEDFISLQILSGMLWAVLGVGCAMLLGASVWMPALLMGATGGLLPNLWLRERRNRRNHAVRRMLPIYLDYITLAVEAGLNFTGAMTMAIDNGPVGALRTEFTLVLRDIKAGLTRAQALRRMHERVGVPELGAFVAAVNQAERSGGALSKVLRAQAERSRSNRFQRAEKAAMEAPVKLLAPLVMFIFPTTFLVIAFPIAMMFLHQ
jgi:tight adherence protein C